MIALRVVPWVHPLNEWAFPTIPARFRCARPAQTGAWRGRESARGVAHPAARAGRIGIMLTTLADLQPVIILVLLMVLYTLEMGVPYLPPRNDKRHHDLHNAALSALSFVTNGAMSLAVLASAAYAERHGLGLLRLLDLPAAVSIPAGMLLYDVGSYAFHNLEHHVPWLWRLHRVHHSDPGLNATSALRFHPLEVVITQGLFPIVWIPMIGMSMASFIVYGTVALLLLIPQHANVRFPRRFEQYGRLVFATPGWHKIHHASEPRLTNSHYGDVFTFWDRIFGTWTPTDPEAITYGLPEFTAPARQSVGFLLGSPFIDIHQASLQRNDGHH